MVAIIEYRIGEESTLILVAANAAVRNARCKKGKLDRLTLSHSHRRLFQVVDLFDVKSSAVGIVCPDSEF